MKIAANINNRAALFEGRAENLHTLCAPKSIGLLCTDPPYSEHTHANLGREKRNDGAKKRDALEFPPLTDAEIAAYADQWVRLVDGWILIFTDDRALGIWGNALVRAGGQWVRTGYYWKTNPMPQMTGDRPGTGAEPIVIGHSDPDVMNLVIGRSHPKGKGRMSWRGGGRPAAWRGTRDAPSITRHPNQKPRWLMQELCGLFAPEGGLVVDPFMGVGSTGVGALATERFPGSETNPKPKRGTRNKDCPTTRSRAAKFVDEYKALPVASESEYETAPMPERLEFLGIEGDPAHVAAAVERVREVCP